MLWVLLGYGSKMQQLWVASHCCSLTRTNAVLLDGQEVIGWVDGKEVIGWVDGKAFGAYTYTTSVPVLTPVGL